MTNTELFWWVCPIPLFYLLWLLVLSVVSDLWLPPNTNPSETKAYLWACGPVGMFLLCCLLIRK